jgi:hypothetical protein
VGEVLESRQVLKPARFSLSKMGYEKNEYFLLLSF